MKGIEPSRLLHRSWCASDFELMRDGCQNAIHGALDICPINLKISSVSDVTRILHAARSGDPTAANQLLPLVYEELRKLAAARMANESAGHTLQPTALVHEAWLRLAGKDADVQFANRAHFFAAAAEAMRRILIERARRKSAEKRGRDWQRIDLDKVDVAVDADDDTLLLVNEALEKLAQEDASAAEMAKLRFFGGLTLEEAAQVLGVTKRTADRYWAFARVWLFDEMRRTLGR
jgi:RNA polymerase sigma factor (TIGR02999 family)